MRPQAGGLGNPQDRLQVAQSARTFLDVGLEVVQRVVILEMALLLLQRLLRVEGLDVERRCEPLAEFADELARPGDAPVLEQAGAYGDIVGHFGLAFGDGARRMRRIQADVPQGGQETLEGRRGCRARHAGVRQQHQHVDIGKRVELGTAVAADRDQCATVGQRELGPQAGQDMVDQPRVLAQKPRSVGSRHEGGLQRRPAVPELPAPVRKRGLAGVLRVGDCGGFHGWEGAPRGYGAGGGGVPAETVNTSKPSGVTSTVCSHCADSE